MAADMILNDLLPELVALLLGEHGSGYDFAGAPADDNRWHNNLHIFNLHIWSWFVRITSKGGEYMSNDALRTFPDGKIEALAMLYLQNQDLSGLAPEEILDKYDDAYQKIKAHNSKKRSAHLSTML